MPDIFTDGGERRLDTYPLSLQSAARALWGDDDFWGRDRPRPAPPATPDRNRRRR